MVVSTVPLSQSENSHPTIGHLSNEKSELAENLKKTLDEPIGELCQLVNAYDTELNREAYLDVILKISKAISTESGTSIDWSFIEGIRRNIASSWEQQSPYGASDIAVSIDRFNRHINILNSSMNALAKKTTPSKELVGGYYLPGLSDNWTMFVTPERTIDGKFNTVVTIKNYSGSIDLEFRS